MPSVKRRHLFEQRDYLPSSVDDAIITPSDERCSNNGVRRLVVSGFDTFIYIFILSYRDTLFLTFLKRTRVMPSVLMILSYKFRELWYIYFVRIAPRLERCQLSSILYCCCIETLRR